MPLLLSHVAFDVLSGLSQQLPFALRAVTGALVALLVALIDTRVGRSASAHARGPKEQPVDSVHTYRHTPS